MTGDADSFLRFCHYCYRFPVVRVNFSSGGDGDSSDFFQLQLSLLIIVGRNAQLLCSRRDATRRGAVPPWTDGGTWRNGTDLNGTEWIGRACGTALHGTARHGTARTALLMSLRRTRIAQTSARRRFCSETSVSLLSSVLLSFELTLTCCFDWRRFANNFISWFSFDSAYYCGIETLRRSLTLNWSVQFVQIGSVQFSSSWASNSGEDERAYGSFVARSFPAAASRKSVVPSPLLWAEPPFYSAELHKLIAQRFCLSKLVLYTCTVRVRVRSLCTRTCGAEPSRALTWLERARDLLTRASGSSSSLPVLARTNSFALLCFPF